MKLQVYYAHWQSVTEHYWAITFFCENLKKPPFNGPPLLWVCHFKHASLVPGMEMQLKQTLFVFHRVQMKRYDKIKAAITRSHSHVVCLANRPSPRSPVCSREPQTALQTRLNEHTQSCKKEGRSLTDTQTFERNLSWAERSEAVSTPRAQRTEGGLSFFSPSPHLLRLVSPRSSPRDHV